MSFEFANVYVLRTAVEGRRRNLTAILRNIFEMTGVNLAFLIIRLDRVQVQQGRVHRCC